MKSLHLRGAVALAAILGISSCTGQKSKCDRVDLSGLIALKQGDPVADEEKAFASHDYRFVGINGYVVVVPGMDEGEPLVRKYGKRMVEGTTDAPCDKEHSALLDFAQRYAITYNKKLASDLIKLPPKGAGGS